MGEDPVSNADHPLIFMQGIPWANYCKTGMAHSPLKFTDEQCSINVKKKKSFKSQILATLFFFFD